MRTLPILIAILLAVTGLQAQTILENNWPQTEARLITLLSGNTEQKRTALAEIRGLRNEQASRLAVRTLRDKDEIVRATASAAVVFLPKDEAAAALLPLLDDKQPFVRREAAYALGLAGGPPAVQRLIAVMNNDRDREARSAAAVALGKIGDIAAMNSLAQVLRKRPTEDDEFLRRSAARSIGQIFDIFHGGNTNTVTPQNFLPPKFKDLYSVDRSQPPVDVDSVVATLSSILQNPKEADDTRREAAFALGAARQPVSEGILRSFITSPDPYLAEISKEALLKIGNRNKIPS